MTPSCPAASALGEERLAGGDVGGHDARDDDPRRQRRGEGLEALARRAVGEIVAVAPQAIEEEHRERQLAAQRSTSSLRPKRRIVIWNGCGAPFGASAIVSPSRISSRAGSGRTASTISGTAAVTSLRLRVKTRTSSPALWTWTRAPSSFHSSAAVPSWASARRDVVRRTREHRLHRLQEPDRRSARARLRLRSARPSRPRAKPAGEHRRAPHRRPREAPPPRRSRRASRPRARPGAARRRAAGRGSPARRRWRGRRACASCAARAAAEPLPGGRAQAVERGVDFARASAACRLPLPVPRGVAQAWHSRRPSLPWRISPERYATAISISSGAKPRSSSVSAAIFARRPEEAVTRLRDGDDARPGGSSPRRSSLRFGGARGWPSACLPGSISSR